ncbi:Uncharacterised protein [Mycobacteroides abscessus subsp. abscessus]|nr:Uncharacterised protein [Mycobacteroides abscessus subsp. abscessus]
MIGSTSTSGTPAQPTQAPLLLRSTGSNAVTRPPGLRFQRVLPSGRRSRSTGSRLATTTKPEPAPCGAFAPVRTAPVSGSDGACWDSSDG